MSPPESEGGLTAITGLLPEEVQGRSSTSSSGLASSEGAAQDRLLAAERHISALRLLTVVAVTGIFVALIRSPTALSGLQYGLLGLASFYAAGVLALQLGPAREFTWLPPVTIIADALLIGAWIFATGALASPFHPLWYVSIVAVAYRFNLAEVAATSILYVSLLAVAITLAGQLPVGLTTMAVHATFIPLTGGLGSLLSVAYEDERTARLKAHAEAQAERLEALDKERARIAAIEEKWRSILENAPEIVMMVDPEGRIEYVNIADTPEDREAVRGAPALDWFPDRMHDRFQAALERVVETGETVTFEIEGRRPGGAPGWYVTRMGPITKEGEVIGASLVSTDITDRRAAEKALESYARELERSHDTVAQYARLAAHDLQEPLRDIAHYAGMLEQRGGDQLPGELEEWGGYAIEGAKRIHELVEAMREFTELDTRALNPRTVEAGALVQHVVGSMQTAIDAHQADVEIGDLPEIRADPRQVERVLEELLDNAIQYGGPEPTVTIDGERRGGEAVLWVADDGPGIREDYRERALEPFRRLHGWDQVPGAGVGLAFAQRVAERHGGTLTISESELGGARIELRLPDDGEPVAGLGRSAEEILREARGPTTALA